MKKNQIKIISSLIFSMVTLSTSGAWAAKVIKSNSTQALVDTEGETMTSGSEYYAINANGKKVAILVVKQSKGEKALLMIQKGRTSAGDTLQSKPSRSNGDQPVDSTISRKKYSLAGGVLAGYAQSTMSMSVQSGTSKEDIKMTDTSYSVKVFADYDLSPTLTVRGASGYETFAAKGTINQALCAGTSSCHANYNYLPLEGSLHYNFSPGKTKMWVGLGYSFLIEMSRDVNIPNLNSESKTNQMLLFGLGADFKLSGKSFVPVVLEYATFPGSTNVTASAIYLRAGYGFGF